MPNPTPLHPTVLAVTERIRQRSALHRSAYLAQVDAAANIGIVTAYNDMLSAHQPYEGYPALIATRRRAWAPPCRWPAACRPCATASPRACPAWS
jgi:hypothetical protein